MFFSKSSVSDDRYYEIVALEITSGTLHAGLWARCMTESGFDEKKAKTKYVKVRIQELKKDEVAECKRNRYALALNEKEQVEIRLHEITLKDLALAPQRAHRAVISSVSAAIGVLVAFVIVFIVDMGPGAMIVTCSLGLILGAFGGRVYTESKPKLAEALCDQEQIASERIALLARLENVKHELAAFEKR